MAVFVPDAGQQPGTDALRCAYGVKKAGDKAHVAQLQHIVPPGDGKALNGQRDRLRRHGVIHRTDAFQPHLTDLPEGVALLTGAIHIFQIIEAAAAALLHLSVLGNGQRYIRLQSQQPPVQIREGDDLLAGEEAAVFPIQAVFLEPPHVVLAEARLLIQQPQLQRNPFLRSQNIQIQFHGSSSLWGIPRFL